MNKISRNDVCWCGSGKKYKKCHMDNDLKLYEFQKEGYIIPPAHIIKTPEQIEGIRKSGKLSNKILDFVSDKIEAGITTEEINSWVHKYTIENGGIPAPLNYNGFPKSVCTSINNVICHGIPDSKTVLKEGDIVNIDITTILDGYFSDVSRMLIIGNASETAVKLTEVARQCLYLGIEQVKPYTGLNNIGKVIEPYANSFGFSVVKDYGGHGHGIHFHEFPHVDHYDKKDKGVLLLPGMVFTIEPMINEGKYNCKTLDDGWTVVTADDSLSAQWEHTVVVTESGVEILA